MYVEAIDEDPGSDDDLDDIFINRRLEVNTSFTEIGTYSGNFNRVTIQMSFRVMCQENYYGADCATFCMAQDDDENGHYTCNSDGSIQCLSGFENPSNNCRDSELIHLCFTIVLLLSLPIVIAYIQSSTHVIQVSVLTMAAVFQWGHLTIPASVLVATLGLPVRMTLMIA